MKPPSLTTELRKLLLWLHALAGDSFKNLLIGLVWLVVALDQKWAWF